MEKINDILDMSVANRRRVALRLGTTAQYLRQVANRERMPSPEFARKLNAATGIPLKTLRPDIWR